ncbi:uncharacterized protein J4E84_010618 [Alternaria hordeiaustralica]|uniref:uncharacterized protein n=1 Tax=Alternaria hordeiaustralica TaxID=1187925 RepID=UPI0020C1E079|nr:uncharacterized protein J4E84_010618 [Alternaria hordeiaustralica]KAI4674380.1 hypothetical protein J4E84_010618 [Alternaria hordeiaustralica]
MPAPTAPAMLPRQGPANGIVVMGYELIGTQDDKPVWSIKTFPQSDGYLFTTGSLYQSCKASSAFEVDGTTTTSPLPKTGCEAWTSCSHTTVYGSGGVTSTCDGDYGLCYSDIMFTTFGASDAYTRIYCDWTGSHPLMSTTLYQALPANVDSTSVASQQAASSTPASNSNPSISAPTPSSTSNPAGEQNQPPAGISGSINTSIIAGAVVGGLAVIAFAGVAIFYILKRSKRHSAGTAVPSSDGDSMNPYGTPEMTRDGYPDAEAYAHTATKHGHTINGGELDGQHGTAELGGVPLHEAEDRR